MLLSLCKIYFFYLPGEWNAMDVRKPVPQWDSFTFTKIDDDLAVAIGGVQQGPGAVNYVYCLQMKESATTNDPEWVCHI